MSELKDEQFKSIMESIDIDIEDIDEKEIVRLEDEIEADIVYETKSHNWLKLLVVIPIGLVVFAVFVGVIFLSQVKIVPVEGIVGAEYSVVGVSIIPDSYRANPKDIVEGGTVVIGSSSDFIGPFMKSFEIAEVGKTSSQYIYIKQEGTKDLKRIPIFDVLYVVNPPSETDTK